MAYDKIKELADKLVQAPISTIILFFGGVFVALSIIHDGRFITVSFLTFFYGVITSYLRVMRRKEDPLIPGDIYIFLHVVLLVLWVWRTLILL